MRELAGTITGAILGGGFWGFFGGIGIVGAGGAIGLGLLPLMGIGALLGLTGGTLSRFFLP